MAGEENVAMVKRLWQEGWNGGDVGVVDEVVAEDAIAHGKTGRQAWKDAIRFYRGAFPDLRYDIDEIFAADGGRVVVRWTATGTDTVGFGMAPTGRRASVTGINIYRADGGKLVEHYDEWDVYGLFQQLGVVPQLPAMP